MPTITSINAQNAGFFSELAYNLIGSNYGVPAGWNEVTHFNSNGKDTTLADLFKTSGVAKDDQGEFVNQFRIFTNGSQVVFAFKGSNQQVA